MFIQYRIIIFGLLLPILLCTCSQVQRCTCINATSTLLCTATSCKTVFYPASPIYSYNHLVFTSDQGCKPCPYNCQICNSEVNCLQCENQYYLTNGTCYPCAVINCYTCDNSTCTSCNSGYYLNQITGLCDSCPIAGTLTCPSVSSISSCQPSYYLSNDGANCIQCDPNCQICLSTTLCGTCNSGFYISQYKCLNCLSTCLSCQNGSACSACTANYYLNSTNQCVICSSTYANCYSCNFNNCTKCLAGYYISSGICKNVTSIISNCLFYSNNSTCSVCQLGYFLSNNQCVFGCSNLCTNCTGASFGLCYACATNTQLFNMNCLPSLNINNGIQYQMLITARNNLQSFSPASSIYCLQTSAGYSSSVSYTLASLSAFNVMVVWKVYLFNLTTTSTISYTVSLNNTIVNTSNTFTLNSTLTDLCANLTGYEFVDKNTFNFSSIAASNVLYFSTSTLISISQILVISDRCGGLYGVNCLVCSSYNNCTACINSSYYIYGANCLASCPTNYYTYTATMTCYQSCPIGSYNVNSNLTCQTCTTGCYSCVNATFCDACISSYYLESTSGTCVTNCSARQYANNASNTCDACIYPCLTCSSSYQCLTCYFGFLDSTTSSCIATCSDGYYGNLTTDTCVSCASTTYNCAKCLNSIAKCLSCAIAAPYLLNYACYSVCPTGYFGNISTCALCSAQCRSCSISASNCTQCNYGYLYNYTCSTCPSGYYQENYNLTCQPCDPSCTTCELNSTFCQSCTSSYYYIKDNSTCVSSCPNLYYVNSNQCSSCVLPCLSCTSATSCLSCQSLYLYNNSCVQSENCPNATYPTVVNYTCTSCNPTNITSGCLTCSAYTNCTSCYNNYYLLNNSCLASCPAQYFINSTICSACVDPCLNCSSLTTCVTCRPGYYFLPLISYCTTSCSLGFYLSNSSCLLCNSSCASCLNSTYCLSCTFGYYLNPVANNSQLCLNSCPTGYYQYNSQCEPCVLPCSSCLDSSRCISCDPVYGIQYQYSCVTNCPTGTYNNNNLTCLLCSSPCATCIGNSTNCTSCQLQNNSILYFQNGLCVVNCSSGYFQNGVLESCSICSTVCLTCQFNQTYCTSCNVGFLYNGDCILACPYAMYSNNSVCISCVSPCLTCSNSTLCLSCVTNYYLQSNSTCVTTCLISEYSQPQTQTCIPCPYPCRRCNDSINCLSCLYGSYYSNQCLEMCPTGYYSTKNASQYNYSICLACSAQCRTCSNQSYCLSCLNNSLYLLNGTCATVCPILYYGDSNGQCLPCLKSCATCVDGNTCSTCNVGFLFNNQCVSTCPDGYVFNNSTCVICTNNCKTCVQNSQTCISCLSSYYLYLSTCVSTCPSATFTYYQTQTCMSCRSPCETCSDEYSCDTCMYGYILYRGVTFNQCVVGPYCPNSYFLNLDLYECISLASCPANSMKQYNYLTCSQTCPNDYVQFSNNNTCLHQCPSGFWADANLICQTINSSTPTLPNFQCRFHIMRNLFVVQCFLNLPSNNLSSMTISNFSLSINCNLTLFEISSQQFTLLVFPADSTITNKQISLTINTRYGIRAASSNIPIQTDPIPINVNQFQAYSMQDRQTGIFMYQIAASISEGAMLFWVAGLIRNRGVESVRLLEILQNLYLLAFLDLNYSPNLGQFLEGFSFSIFSFLPQISISNDQNSMMDKFYVLNKGVSFLAHCLPYIILISTFLFIQLTMLLVNKIISRYQQDESYVKISKKLNILLSRFTYDYWNDCIYVITIPIFLNTFAQCTLISQPISYFSVILGGLFTLAIVFMVCFLVYQLYHCEKKIPLCYEFSSRGTNSTRLGKYYLSMLYLEKMLKSLLFVAAYNYPTFIMGCLILLSICNIIVYLQKPYAIDLTNYFNIVEQILNILLNITITVALLNPSLTSQQRISIGWVSCLIIIIIIMLGVVFSSAQLLMYEWFEWQENKVIQEKKQEQENQQLNQNLDDSNFNKIKTFFSKAEIQKTDSSFESEVNVIKKDYLFESESQKSQEPQIPKYLIKCIKPGYQQDDPQKQFPQQQIRPDSVVI